MLLYYGTDIHPLRMFIAARYSYNEILEIASNIGFKQSILLPNVFHGSKNQTYVIHKIERQFLTCFLRKKTADRIKMFPSDFLHPTMGE